MGENHSFNIFVRFTPPYCPLKICWSPLRVKIQNISQIGFMVFKICVLKPRFQQSKRKNNPTSWGREINPNVPKFGGLAYLGNFGTVWLISRPHDVGLFFRLLRWNRGFRAQILNTINPICEIFWILTLRGDQQIFSGQYGGVKRTKMLKLRFSPIYLCTSTVKSAWKQIDTTKRLLKSTP
jgi:hypothetical protein